MRYDALSRERQFRAESSELILNERISLDDFVKEVETRARVIKHNTSLRLKAKWSNKIEFDLNRTTHEDDDLSINVVRYRLETNDEYKDRLSYLDKMDKENKINQEKWKKDKEKQERELYNKLKKKYGVLEKKL